MSKQVGVSSLLAAASSFLLVGLVVVAIFSRLPFFLVGRFRLWADRQPEARCGDRADDRTVPDGRADELVFQQED